MEEMLRLVGNFGFPMVEALSCWCELMVNAPINWEWLITEKELPKPPTLMLP